MHHPYMPMPPCPILGIVYNRPMAGLNIASQTWELYDFPGPACSAGVSSQELMKFHYISQYWDSHFSLVRIYIFAIYAVF